MKREFFRQIFAKYINIKFHENPSTGAGLFHADGRTDGQRDIPKLIVATRRFANAPKKKFLNSDTIITDCMLVSSSAAIGNEFRKCVVEKGVLDSVMCGFITCYRRPALKKHNVLGSGQLSTVPTTGS